METKLDTSVDSEQIMQNEEDKKYLLKIKNGDENALNKIMDKYKNFVYAKAKTFFLVGAEQEDIVQEGMIGLFKAIKGYDTEKILESAQKVEVIYGRKKAAGSMHKKGYLLWL